MNCMLQLRVHYAGIICTIACHGINTNISDCDCQHEISYYCIYCSRPSVSDMYHFYWVNFNLCFFSWMHSRWVWLENLPFSNGLLATLVWIFNLNSELETCTGTWIFNWELGLETWIFNWDLGLEPTYLLWSKHVLL